MDYAVCEWFKHSLFDMYSSLSFEFIHQLQWTDATRMGELYLMDYFPMAFLVGPGVMLLIQILWEVFVLPSGDVHI